MHPSPTPPVASPNMANRSAFQAAARERARRHFEIELDVAEEAERGSVPRTPSGPSLMGTQASEVLRPLTGAAPQPQADPAADLAQLLETHGLRHPDQPVAGVLLGDAWAMARRNWRVTLPTAGTFLGSFVVAQCLTTFAGFECLLPLPSRPFNPQGLERRTLGAALAGWSSAIGVTTSILSTTLVQILAQRWNQHAPRTTPPSPAADRLWASMGAMAAPHQGLILATVLFGVYGFFVPQSVAAWAGFAVRFDNLPSRPFNPGGRAHYTLSSALFGIALPASVAGLVLAVVTAQGLGRGLRAARHRLG